jgi:uncharacterized membrane protein
VSYYEILLFLHLVAAAVWLGAAVTLHALFVRARGTDDGVLIERLTKNSDWLVTRVFVPTSLAALVLGILLTIEGSWGFDQLWILLGLFGFAAIFALGLGVIEREGKQLDKALDDHGYGHPLVAYHLRRIDAFSKLDLVLLLVVVFDMSLKPTGDDVGTLILGAIAVLAAGAYVLRESRQPAPVGVTQTA